MDFVIIAVGFKKTFAAEHRSEAVARAKEIAQREHLTSWLLYDRAGDLIFEQE